MTSIVTAFLHGVLVVMTSPWIPARPTAPTLDRQNPSAKAVWGKMLEWLGPSQIYVSAFPWLDLQIPVRFVDADARVCC